MTARTFTVYKGYYLVPYSQHVGDGRYVGHCDIRAHYPRAEATEAAMERVTAEGEYVDAEAAARAASLRAQAVVDTIVGPTPSPSDRPWDSR